MRTLKFDEEELKRIIEAIIDENFLGISMKDLQKKLKLYGFKVSPQVVRRNVIKLVKEKKINIKRGKLEHG